MRLSKQQIRMMLQMQSEMNAKINDQWILAGYPFLRAVVVEGGEMMDHVGYKWWKHQSPNLPQVQLEMVDVFHFLLSSVLIDFGGDIEMSCEWLEKRLAAIDGPEANKVWLLEKEFNLEDMNLLEKIELLIGFSVFRKISIPLFGSILMDCEMDWTELHRQYIAKNVLNFFRNDHGYQRPGEYRKHWHDGREDNEHLVEVMAEVDEAADDLRDRLYRALETRYSIMVQ